MEQTKELTTSKSNLPIIDGQIRPQDFDGLWRVATMYAKSGMVPKQYIDNPSAIIVAGQFGAELGLTLMPSMQNVAVINGNPTLWGDAMLAIVRSSGTLEVFVEFFTGKPFEDTYCAVCIAKRSGVGFSYDPGDDLDAMRRKGLFVNEYSVEDAKRAGLWGGKGKEQWQKEQSSWFSNPKRMLKMRARAFTLRDGWPDKLKGMHSTEEIMDAVDIIEVKGRAVNAKQEQISFANPMKTDAELAESFDTLAAGNDGIDAWLSEIGKAQNMSLERVKAEIIRSNDIENCLANFQKYQAAQKPPEKPVEQPKEETNTPVWDWLKSGPLERYGKDKSEILKAAALERGLDITGMKPAQVHLKLISLAQGDFEDMKLRPTQQPGPDTSENDTALLMAFNELWAGDDPAAKDYASDECGVGNYDQAKAKAGEWIAKYREYLEHVQG